MRCHGIDNHNGCFFVNISIEIFIISIWCYIGYTYPHESRYRPFVLGNKHATHRAHHISARTHIETQCTNMLDLYSQRWIGL